jgi:hypothetical protein
MTCPSCGGSDIDPAELISYGDHGPVCLDCFEHWSAEQYWTHWNQRAIHRDRIRRICFGFILAGLVWWLWECG